MTKINFTSSNFVVVFKECWNLSRWWKFDWGESVQVFGVCNQKLQPGRSLWWR